MCYDRRRAEACVDESARHALANAGGRSVDDDRWFLFVNDMCYDRRRYPNTANEFSRTNTHFGFCTTFRTISVTMSNRREGHNATLAGTFVNVQHAGSGKHTLSVPCACATVATQWLLAWLPLIRQLSSCAGSDSSTSHANATACMPGLRFVLATFYFYYKRISVKPVIGRRTNHCSPLHETLVFMKSQRRLLPPRSARTRFESIVTHEAHGLASRAL
jgi:hypothetical protein